ncbi:MAG: phosphoribosylformylglycinamidine synthase subunit PurS [Candidatus Rokubacteria bacterium]|nr:phosphoribosylformylglycinamidine synthase subunit PurS [Candidatus Rokubacteria bacterium]
MRARVFVRLKRGILDPQGTAVKRALEGLGYREVQDLRVGRVLEMELDATQPDQARGRLEEMCRRLLANPGTEEFTVEIVEDGGRPRLA